MEVTSKVFILIPEDTPLSHLSYVMAQYEPHKVKCESVTKVKCDSETSSRVNYRKDQKRERGMEAYFEVYQ